MGLDFAYLDEDDYDENWDSEIKEHLPQVIEITMYVRENDIIHPFRSAALIPTMRVQSRTVTRSEEAAGNAGAVNEAARAPCRHPARWRRRRRRRAV